mgnify:CR=1 FL=1
MPADGRAGDRGALTIGFVARAMLVAIGLWWLAQMLWLGRELVFVAFFSVLVSLFLSFFVDQLEEVGFPRALAAILVMLALLGVLVGLGALAWPTLKAQFITIRRELPAALSDVERWLRTQYQAITGQVGAPNGQVVAQLQDRLGREVANVVAGALPLLNTVVGAVAGLLIVVVAGVYLTIESRLYLDGVTLLVPPSARQHVRRALTDAGHDLRRWILGTVINMVTIGVLTTVGLWILGIPAALALGLIAGILEFVPTFGPILSAVPAVAVALLISPAKAFWVIVLYFVIQQLESNIMTPLVMKSAVQLPPALTLLFTVLMAVVFGFLGLLLAVPILAATITLVKRLYVERIEANGA